MGMTYCHSLHVNDAPVVPSMGEDIRIFFLYEILTSLSTMLSDKHIPNAGLTLHGFKLATRCDCLNDADVVTTPCSVRTSAIPSVQKMYP